MLKLGMLKISRIRNNICIQLKDIFLIILKLLTNPFNEKNSYHIIYIMHVISRWQIIIYNRYLSLCDRKLLYIFKYNHN